MFDDPVLIFQLMIISAGFLSAWFILPYKKLYMWIAPRGWRQHLFSIAIALLVVVGAEIMVSVLELKTVAIVGGELSAIALLTLYALAIMSIFAMNCARIWEYRRNRYPQTQDKSTESELDTK
ncbi:hypothetical protein [Saccharospirillum salsuginis]|uniref:Uncharacterized protein n=1 Tax=Saccharospirillum salsuginis TaxID=418750 RepID=A0A918K9C0_9GAMM|nr:hypothetical protein [Saccharospirillum salsuginis]GGX52614.1 hypothetical protein GCM10007392_19990 [Saccharospirillum salsuginis]